MHVAASSYAARHCLGTIGVFGDGSDDLQFSQVVEDDIRVRWETGVEWSFLTVLLYLGCSNCARTLCSSEQWVRAVYQSTTFHLHVHARLPSLAVSAEGCCSSTREAGSSELLDVKPEPEQEQDHAASVHLEGDGHDN